MIHFHEAVRPDGRFFFYLAAIYRSVCLPDKRRGGGGDDDYVDIDSTIRMRTHTSEIFSITRKDKNEFSAQKKSALH